MYLYVINLEKAWSILAVRVYFTCLVVVTGGVQTPRNLKLRNQ